MPGSVHAGVGVAVWTSSDCDDAARLPRVDDLILMGIRKGSHGEGLLALPGGWLEWGEDAAQTGARELAEETGICCACATQTGAEVAATVCAGEDGKASSVATIVEAEIAPLAVPSWGNLFAPDGRVTTSAFGGRTKEDVAMHTITTFVGARLHTSVTAVTMEPHKTEGWAWLRLGDLVATASASLGLAPAEDAAVASATSASVSLADASAGDCTSRHLVATPLFPAAAAFVLYCAGVKTR